jgi:hypothetical protein
MLRRLAILAGLLTTAGTPGVLLSTPAYAVDHVICVGGPAGIACDQTAPSITAAIAAANGNGVDDTIAVAPGTYTDGPYFLNGITHRITLQGSGQGSTVISAPTNPAGEQNVVSAVDAGIEDLTVDLTASSMTFSTGVAVSKGAVAQSVTVDGIGTQGETGIASSASTVRDASITMTLAPAAATLGIFTTGTSSITDCTITASSGVYKSIGAGTATLSRLTVRASVEGLRALSGSIDVDDTVVDLGTSDGAVGLTAHNLAPDPTPQGITADHVTITGGGAGSVGVHAAASADAALQTASVVLTNSIVSGPATDLVAAADNDGAQGADSTATITTSYSDWSTKHVSNGANGTATIASGPGHLDVDPGFVDASGGDYRLAPTSHLIDRGAPGTGGPSVDLAGHPRVLDGDADGIAVRDPGAYEAPTKLDTTSPDTTLTSHPRKRTGKHRVTFGFASDEAHANFQCRLDKRAWASCTSPTSYRVDRGRHVFSVRARDAAGNVDATPATWRFKRV